MRLPLCILALAMSAWAADVPQPIDPQDQAQAPAPQTPAPPDATKPADTTPPAPPPKYDGFVFSAMADGYFTVNFNHPESDHNQLYNFNNNSALPELNLVKVTIDKSDKMFGFHIDAGFGETMREIHAGDVAAQAHKALRYEEQAYAIFKPSHTHGAEIDYGMFVTAAGAEVIESSSNWNYSRSLLFSWAIPYYHSGFRVNVPVTKTWTVGVQVVNAWNSVWGNHNLKNIGVTSTLTKAKYTWSTNYYEGNNNFGTDIGRRHLVDTTVLFTPSSKINYYVNGDWGSNGNPTGYGSAQWYGVAAAAHFQLTKRFAISPRIEIFDDRNGFSTGVMQTIKEGTLTGEYKYNDHFIGRLEYRHDFSNAPFFDRGADLIAEKNQTTLSVALMVILGPLK